MDSTNQTRRKFFTSIVFGSIGFSLVQASPFWDNNTQSILTPNNDLFYRYPAINDTIVAEIVSASHGRFDKVKELVSKRPELAKSCWDWGFGDYESAIGAAAHMGRKDIAEYLIEHGARPDIFTFAMLGELGVIKAMVAASPGIQKTHGPHGFTLLQHAKSRLWDKNISHEDRVKANEMIAYLESLGDAHIPTKSLQMNAKEQGKYVGEYRWGNSDKDVFYVKINKRKLLHIGKKGTFGRAMHKIDNQIFTPSGAPSVRIHFIIENGKASSLTVHEPDPIVTAIRI